MLSSRSARGAERCHGRTRAATLGQKGFDGRAAMKNPPNYLIDKYSQVAANRSRTRRALPARNLAKLFRDVRIVGAATEPRAAD